MIRNRRYHWVWLAVWVAAWPLEAPAQVAPTGAQYGAKPSDTGHTGTVNAQGGYGATVPLDVPRARGDLPVPLQIVYGGMRVGAAGLGWDVPLSYIFRDTTINHRRPAQTGTTTLVAREQITLVLDGKRMTLVPKGTSTTVFLVQTDGPQIEVRQTGTGLYTAYDGNGLTYYFSTRDQQHGDMMSGNLALLRDIVGRGNKVHLEYSITRPALPGGGEGLAIDLVNLAYNLSPSDSNCAKNRINLAYTAPGTQPLSMIPIGDQMVARMDTLLKVDIQSRATCADSQLSVRRYDLSYLPDGDPDTHRPRMSSVTVIGRQGTDERNKPMIVANYGYGAASSVGDTGRKLHYELTAPVPATLPPQTKLVLSVAGKYAGAGDSGSNTIINLTDLTGDGRPDFNYMGTVGSAQIPVMIPNLAGGVFTTPAIALSQTVFGSRPLEGLESQQVRFSAFNEDHVWRQMIDFNGDGRLDVVDAKEIQNRWVVYLNTQGPGGPADIKWLRYELDIHDMGLLLKGRSFHIDESSGYIPLTARVTGRKTEVFHCYRYKGGPAGSFSSWNEQSNGCTIPQDFNGPEQTFTEYELRDMNADGFPDVVLNSAPVKVVNDAFDPPSEPNPVVGSVYLGGRYRDLRPPEQVNHRIDIMFNRAGNHLEDKQVFDLASPETVRTEGDTCGVSGWAEVQANPGHRSFEDRITQQICGFADVNGDGIPDRIEQTTAFLASGHLGYGPTTISLPGAMARQFSTHNGNECGSIDANGRWVPFPHPTDYAYAEGVAALRDLNGDGIADYVTTNPSTRRQFVSFGTGIGFAAPLAIDVNASLIDISIATEDCLGTFSLTTAGLFDIDGDGKADFIVRPNLGDPNQQEGIGAYRLKSGATAGTPEAGRLIQIDNGFGAFTKVTYANAKEDGGAPHQVAFPEIVVASEETIDTTGSTPVTLSQKTEYAYGTPQQIHDPTTDAYVFSGYRRKVALQRLSSTAGTAVISDTYALPVFVPSETLTKQQRLARNLRTGRPSDVTLLSGALGTSTASSLLSVDIATNANVIGSSHFTWDVKLQEQAPAITITPDCVEQVVPYNWQASALAISYNPCRDTGFAYQSRMDVRRCEPGARPPSPSCVYTFSGVSSIDDFGRVMTMNNLLDVASTSDGLVTQTVYPSTVPPNERVLNAPLERRVFQGTTLLAHEVWERTALGYPTKLTVTRIKPSGEVIGDRIMFQEAVYDAAGNPTTMVQTREDGAKRTVTTDYDPFGIEQIGSQISGAGGPGAVGVLQTKITLDPLSLKVTNRLNVTDPTNLSGPAIGAVYDGFDRDIVSTATPVGGAVGATGTTQYIGFAVGQGGKRSIAKKVFTDQVPVDQVATAAGRLTTTSLDAAGRAIMRIVELGADYQAKKLVVGARTYDALGRVAFEADAFELGQFAGTAYGTTNYFNTDGTPLVSIRGSGPQPATTATNESAQIYRTSFMHSFQQFQETFSVFDASANLVGSPQQNVAKSSYLDALGRVVTQATWRDGVRLELATHGYDPLGHMSTMSRYRLPVEMDGRMDWTWSYDSLGQMLELDESNRFSGARRWTYDNWGEVVSVSYNDDVVRESTSRYDAIGRLIHKHEQNGGVVDPQTVYDYKYDQAVDVPGRLTATNVLGHLAQTLSPTTRVSYSYDGFGRINGRAFIDDSVAAKPVYVEKYSRHVDGSAQSLVLNLPDNAFRDERVDYGYDTAGRAKTVSFSDGVSSQSLLDTTSMDVFGRVNAAKYGLTSYAATYDDFGRRLLTDLSITSGTHSREIAFPATTGLSAAFDPKGRERRRTEITDGTSRSDANFYDALGRLSVRAPGSTPWTLINYDAIGNVDSSYDFVVGTSTHTHVFSVHYLDTDRDQISCINRNSSDPNADCVDGFVSYDQAGNVTQDSPGGGVVRKFKYYAAGQVKQITDGQSQADFVYDPFGDVQKLTLASTVAVNARSDQHFSSMLSQRSEMSSGGTWSTVLNRSIPGPSGFLATRHGASGPWIFGFGDKRGSRFFTDETGAFVQDVSYRAYGEATSSRPPGTARYSSNQWNGGDLLEAFGLVKLGARLYDPVIGRFLSRDPLLTSRTAATTNPYAFAMNDPINLSDPSGLDTDPHDFDDERFVSIFRSVGSGFGDVLHGTEDLAWSFRSFLDHALDLDIRAVADDLNPVGKTTRAMADQIVNHPVDILCPKGDCIRGGTSILASMLGPKILTAGKGGGIIAVAAGIGGDLPSGPLAIVTEDIEKSAISTSRNDIIISNPANDVVVAGPAKDLPPTPHPYRPLFDEGQTHPLLAASVKQGLDVFLDRPVAVRPSSWFNAQRYFLEARVADQSYVRIQPDFYVLREFPFGQGE